MITSFSDKGKCRCAAVVMAYLMKKYGTTFKKALFMC